MAYLDNTGLAYFWGKIKAWANSAFALLGHTHSASDVTLMTGYSKPASSSAILASDSLNQAVGKLEKGMELSDGNAVHKTGDETVTGTKVFKNGLVLQNDNIPSSGTPSANTAINLMARDIDTTYTHGIYFYRDTTPDSVMYFRVFKPNDSSVYANMQLGYNNDGTTYLIAPSTLASRNNGTDVLTRDWIPKDTRIVHITGNEIIAGSKTFANILRINNSAIPASGIPSSTQAINLIFSNIDNSKNQQAIIGQSNPGVNTSILYMRACKLGDSTQYADLRIIYDSDNNLKYATCPTPEVTANSEAIATTAWVRTFCDTTQKYMKAVSVTGSGNAVTAASLSNGTLTLTKDSTFLTSHQSLANYVTLNSAQTITGTKRFSDDIRIGKLSPGVACINSAIADAKDYSGSGYKFCFTCLYDNSGTTNDDHSVGRIWIAQGKDSVAYSCIRFDTWAPDSNHDFQGIIFYNYAGSSTNLFFPSSDNKVKLGEASHRWIQLVAATGTISTSDERQKSYISAIDENLLDAWDNVEFTQYKFNDAIEEKYDNARFHTGAIAQAIEKACKSKNVDISRYGLFCYDSWDAKDAEYDDSGNIISNGVKAGDAYSLRYDEVLCVEAAWQRRENARLKKRVADLEERLAALELRLGSD